VPEVWSGSRDILTSTRIRPWPGRGPGAPQPQSTEVNEHQWNLTREKIATDIMSAEGSA